MRRGAGSIAGALVAWSVLATAGARAQAPVLGADDPAVAAIRFYQRHVSSLRQGRCRFVPSCSEYAAQAIARYGLVEGSSRAADRLVRCNASASGFYARSRDGRLVDPVEPNEGGDAGLRLPDWLLVEPEPRLPPDTTGLDPGRRARLEEAVVFAERLRDRGDAGRAATEFQRAASLCGGAAAESWAFARIGESELAAARWTEADRAFLSAGMLAPTDDGRARAAYRAAVSRFGAGALAACSRLLEDPVLARADGPGTRIAALRGLCALGLGDWTRAARDLDRASAGAGDDSVRSALLGLERFAAEGPRLPRRSAALATALSAIVPGSGQMLCGRARDGVRHLVVDAVLTWTVVSFARDRRWPAACVTGGVALPFYLGNVIGAGEAARAYDRDRRLALVREALRESRR